MAKNLSRREFLKSSAVGAAGIAALGILGSASALSSESAGDYRYEADVIIVGAGAAGYTAAAGAHENGASTLILEKAGFVGGDTIMCNQAILAYWPQQQLRDVGSCDTPESYLADWKASHWASQKAYNGEPEGQDFPFTERFMELFPRAGEWSVNEAGLTWLPRMSVNKGMPAPTWDTFAPRIWATTGIIPAFDAAVQRYEDCTILTETEVYALLQDDTGRVVGIRALDGDGNSFSAKANKAVILACGSFNANTAMVSQYLSPTFGRLSSAGSNMNTGDGIRMARQVGADLTHMDLGTHCFPALLGSNDPWRIFRHISKFNATEEALALNDPAIYINMDGRRYMKEAMGYSWLGRITAMQKYSLGYYVLDSVMMEEALTEGDVIYMQADTLEELAMRMNVDQAAFLGEVERYNGFVDANQDEDFQKPLEGCTRIETAPFYAFPMQPQTYACYGGIRTDVDSHVLDSEGNIIPGLFAAGICTGVFAEQEGLFYYGGVSQAMAFGMQAGEKAAREE